MPTFTALFCIVSVLCIEQLAAAGSCEVIFHRENGVQFARGAMDETLTMLANSPEPVSSQESRESKQTRVHQASGGDV